MNKTLVEQVNKLIQMEQEMQLVNLNTAHQIFGADVNDEDKVVNDGKRGFRVIEHTTQLDSQGTDENEPQMSDKDLFRSAWMEVDAFNKQRRIGDGATMARRQALIDQEADLVKRGLENPDEEEEINNEISELRALNKGCLTDLTLNELNRNFIEREIEPWSPEMLGFQFDNPSFNRFFDEAEKEIVPFKKVRLEDKNWIHIQAMNKKRVERFEWLKVKIRDTYEDAKRLKKLKYNVIFREKLNEFNQLKFKILEARNYSFAHKLLDSMAKNVKGKPWFVKRAFYLKLDIQKRLKEFNIEKHLSGKDKIIYRIYNETRGLTKQQYDTLMDGWTKMQALLIPPKGH